MMKIWNTVFGILSIIIYYTKYIYIVIMVQHNIMCPVRGRPYGLYGVSVILRRLESRENARQPLYSEHIVQVGATASLEFDYNIAIVLSGFVDMDTVYCYFYILGRVDSCRGR